LPASSGVKQGAAFGLPPVYLLPTPSAIGSNSFAPLHLGFFGMGMFGEPALQKPCPRRAGGVVHNRRERELVICDTNSNS